MNKEVEGPSTTGIDRACTNGRSRENKYSYSMPKSVGGIHTMQPILYEGRL